MKLLPTLSILTFMLACAPLAQAQRINCNHDPVCQAKRDGTSVETARSRDKAMTSCLRAVGYSQPDWHAYRVPPGPATKVRECFARHGLPTS